MGTFISFSRNSSWASLAAPRVSLPGTHNKFRLNASSCLKRDAFQTRVISLVSRLQTEVMIMSSDNSEWLLCSSGHPLLPLKAMWIGYVQTTSDLAFPHIQVPTYTSQVRAACRTSLKDLFSNYFRTQLNTKHLKLLQLHNGPGGNHVIVRNSQGVSKDRFFSLFFSFFFKAMIHFPWKINPNLQLALFINWNY